MARRKTYKDMQDLMKDLVEDAKSVLQKHMQSKDGKVAVLAATAVLDRGLGRPGTAQAPKGQKKPVRLVMNLGGAKEEEPEETKIDLAKIDGAGYA
jgi:hypothetical protein|tara:strand:- start:1111 stop:1398 length:288 start_codon:yes stop_codon:yes gene_type:complete